MPQGLWLRAGIGQPLTISENLPYWLLVRNAHVAAGPRVLGDRPVMADLSPSPKPTRGQLWGKLTLHCAVQQAGVDLKETFGFGSLAENSFDSPYSINQK